MTRTITTTTPRYCSETYKLPTVEIRLDTPDGATAGDLVEIHKTATPGLMHDAHRVAALLWAKNTDGRKIDLEPQGNGLIHVTVEPLTAEPSEVDAILALMSTTLDLPVIQPQS